jgi:hypothetical protein
VIEKPGSTKSELVAHARALLLPTKYLGVEEDQSDYILVRLTQKEGLS